MKRLRAFAVLIIYIVVINFLAIWMEMPRVEVYLLATLVLLIVDRQ